jgi:hypothetical protein
MLPQALIQVVGVYVDNSFSMNALSEKGQLLELARNKAAEIGQSYPAGTRFMIFTNDLEPRHQNLLNKEQFISQVIDLKQSPAVIPLSFINNRFEQLSAKMNRMPRELYISSPISRDPLPI